MTEQGQGSNQEGQALLPPNIRIVRGSDERSGYATHISVTVTAEESILRFAELDHENPTTATGFAKIYLSNAHLKRIVLAAAQILTEHEVRFGEIQIDPLARLTKEGREALGMPADE